MRQQFSRFVFQTLTRLPRPISAIARIETHVRNPNLIRSFSATAQESKPAPSERVSGIVDEISGLTLLEISDLTEVLRKKMGIEEMPMMAVMMPGMGFAPGMAGAKGKGGGGGAAKEEEEKKEKTAFDLKLEGGFDAAAKIKIIKEVRACTDLGLKEAKDLVEKAPTLLKKGVTKDEAEKIIEKMKGVGAKVIME
ncbi:50S ribosomal protein L7/L12 [Sesamum alatum]|uniref:Large ribosomal subunit protein bL12c n=1 Tax=Sesamum alatum TaxID=300844 RepID=A0AAE2CCU5_9LAMI|nr:50S ribosomal protein L7/L12 [Sesamum alatum]